jgi:hypothetical protein
VVYVQSYVDYSVKAELSGTIDIEIASPDRYRHSFELLMSKNTTELRQKLYDDYDPAIRALTAKPELVFEAGRLRIDAPIAAEADVGPFISEVKYVNPTTMKGIIKPNPISGTVAVGGLEYKYLAKIEFGCEIIWHKRPEGETVEPVKIPVYEEKPGLRHKSGWEQKAKDAANDVVKVTIAAVLALAILVRLPQVLATQMSRISMPIIYSINPNDPRYMRYTGNNEA